MPEISNKKRKFIKRNYKQLSIEELVRQTGLKPQVIRSLIDEYTAEIPEKDQDTSKKLISNKGLLTKRSLKIIWIGATVIFLLTFMIYTPALKNDFVNWDDSTYVYENPHIQSLDFQSLHWMLTSFYASNWHPLTWLSHAIDYAFWELNQFGHHLTNIILHGLNTLLVFLLAIRLTLRTKETGGTFLTSKISPSIPTKSLLAAGVTALLFGIHPLHVESVAWVAERKDLLCALFFLLTLLSYLSYTSSEVKRHQRFRFSICLLLFLLALMSKPMAVTLPLILLLLDIYPLKRMSLYPSKTGKSISVFLEKIPFFALSVASGIITTVAQHYGEAIKSFVRMPLSIRLVNGLHSLVLYLEKMIWPHKLVPFYPLPKYIDRFDPAYIIPVILVLAITGICLWRMKKGEYLLFIVWSYYVITLIPVLGIIQVGDQAAADRYTYLPSLSIFLLVGIGISWVFERRVLIKHKGLFGGLALAFICILILLGQLTIKQIKVWHNTEILWSYVISAFPKSVPIAHNNLGYAYDEKGRLDEAISEYKKALAINPHHLGAHYNLGNAYGKLGRLDAAIAEYKQELAINPDYAEAHTNLGNAYIRMDRVDEAISEYKQALAIKPDFVYAHNNLGNAYFNKGWLDEAIAAYKNALDIRPRYATAHNNLGTVYNTKGAFDEAISECRKAIAINPNYAKAHSCLGVSYYSKRNYKLAIYHYDKAMEFGARVNPKLLELLKPYR